MASRAEKGITQTLSAGAINSRRRAAESGVTLIELLIVLTLIALVTGISYPSAAAGVVILAALATWGTYSGLIVDPYSFFAQFPTMDAERLFVGFGLIASLALGALCFWRLLNPAPLSFVKSAMWVDLLPGAAQRSRMRSPSFAPSTCATNCDASSWR